MTARVHPGETPASHVLEGLLSFLLREDDPRAIALRERYVFKLVPILNPDGVYNGHYRADTLGQNLNRCYGHAQHGDHPTCFAVNALVRQLHARQALQFYVDTHGHATKRGCFLYGNCLADHERMVENVLYAQLVAANCRWFDFGGCVFTKSFMSKADKRDGLSREGSARVAIFKRTDLTHVYTLESSYNTGRLVNRIEAMNVPSGADRREVRDLSPPPPPPRSGLPKYTPESWAAVGRALAISVLDLAEANPVSRLGPLGGGGLTRLRGVVGAWCRTEARKEAAKALKAAFKKGSAVASGSGGGRGGGDGGGGGGDDDGMSGGSGDDDDDEPEMRGEEEAGLSDEEEEAGSNHGSNSIS